MDAIKDALLTFLTDASARVTIFKGEWGIGKTFFWKNFLNEHKAKLKVRAYSYVSLFGVTDISNIKHQIIANTEVLDESLFKRAAGKLKHLSNILKNLDIPYVKLSAPIEMLEAKLIRNYLICIDDFERKEESLTSSSILGLIANLKEERGCKVILIYNEERLSEDTKNQINEYREKIVDLEIAYKPSIDDLLLIVWPKGSPQYVNDIFKTLNLNNIRVMQKVKWAGEYFATTMQQYPYLAPSLQKKCVDLTIIHHIFSKQVTIDDAISENIYARLMSKDEGEKEKYEILKKFNYYSEDFDVIVADYLRNGYVDFQEHAKMLQGLNEKYRINNLNEEHRKIWGEYHSSTSVTQDEFVGKQLKFLSEHAADMSLMDVDTTVKCLKELGVDAGLDAILEAAVDRFVESFDGDIRKAFRHTNISDEARARIDMATSAKTQNFSLGDLMVELAGSNSWNPADVANLTHFTQDAFLQWINTEKNLDVPELIKEFLGRFKNTEGHEKTVCDRLRGALADYKEQSLLNKWRVEKIIFGGE